MLRCHSRRRRLRQATVLATVRRKQLRASTWTWTQQCEGAVGWAFVYQRLLVVLGGFWPGVGYVMACTLVLLLGPDGG